MARTKVTAEARWQAGNLALDAMNARSDAHADRLLRKALALDPRCVDARVMMSTNMDDREREGFLRGVLADALEDLGGERFVRKTTGHFWGDVATRPYMRTRLDYAQTLMRLGKLEASIGEMEDMLVLNPGDNQGVRYVLMGLYLMANNVDGARRLQAQYDDEPSPTFAWADVLTRYITGDRPGAEKALARARSLNAHVEPYLTGLKRLPSEMPTYFSRGDVTEAVSCMGDILMAWTMHPDAIRWVREHPAPTHRIVGMPAGVKPKVGRNDPCPCGSGLKYKRCCMGRDLDAAQAQAQAQAQASAPASVPVPAFVTGSPRTTSERVLRDLQQAIGGREFASLDEANAFAAAFQSNRNSTPKEDFEGLSPDQMDELIYHPFDSPDCVEFAPLLDAEPTGPMVTLFCQLVEAIGTDGLKPTAAGNLPRKVVQDVAKVLYATRNVPSDPRFIEVIRKEDDLAALAVTRRVAESAGLIRRYRGRFILSVACRKMLKQGGMRAVFPALLRAYAVKYNWAYHDRFPDFDTIQRYFAFTLFLFSRHGDTWNPISLYADAFIKAFPSADRYETGADDGSSDDFELAYGTRFRRLFDLTGLAETRYIPGQMSYGVFEVRSAPLLSDAVRFHV